MWKYVVKSQTGSVYCFQIYSTHWPGQLFSLHNINTIFNVQTVQINRVKEAVDLKCVAWRLCFASEDFLAYLWKGSIQDACSQVEGHHWQIPNFSKFRDEGWPVLGRGWSSQQMAKMRWVSSKVEAMMQTSAWVSQGLDGAHFRSAHACELISNMAVNCI